MRSTSTAASSISRCVGACPAWRSSTWGDQFLALAEGDSQPPAGERHFGLVVDDLEGAHRALKDASAEILPGRGLLFRDPWGNQVEVVQYSDVQFSKAPAVLEGMGLAGLDKSDAALEELRDKGLG